MRADLTAPQLALLEASPAAKDSYWLLQVANGDGTLIDLSSRIVTGTWKQPGPDQPIATLSLSLVRDLGTPASSLAPLVGASLLNRLDNGTTYSPQLQVGRAIRLKVVDVAKNAGRPSAGSFVEVFRGNLSFVSAPDEWGPVSIQARDEGGKLNLTWTEHASTYPIGALLQNVMQGVIDNEFGAGAYTLNIPSAPTPAYAITEAFEPDGSVWSIDSQLAARLGWVVWFRYNASGVPVLTFFEPERAKVTPDFTHNYAHDISQLDIDDDDIRNVVEGIAYLEDGSEIAATVEDAASILKYGGGVAPGIRRYMRLVEEPGSVVRDAASLNTFISAALSDLKDPDAVMRMRVPLFWAGEVSVDLYEFPALEQFYDSAQNFAPFAIEHTINGGVERSYTTLSVRGAPTAGARTWAGRSAVLATEPDEVYGLSDLSVKRGDATAVISWVRGAKVDGGVYVHEMLFTEPTPDYPWPDSSTGAAPAGATYTFTILPHGTDTYTVTIPAALTTRYIQLEARRADLSFGPGVLTMRRIEVGPNQVPTVGIVDDAVTTAKIAPLAVTVAELADAAVERAKILDGAINDLKLAALSVTAAKVAVGAIETDKIAALAVTAAKIGNAAVETAKLANLAVTEAILAANAVTVTKIADDAVTTPKLIAGAVVASKIAAGTITSNEIAANTIVAGDIAAGTITTNEIASNTIVAGNIAASTITGAKIAALTIEGGNIAAATIAAGKLVAATITANEIASNAITSAKINAGAVTADKLSVTSLSAITANLGSVTIDTPGNGADITLETSGSPIGRIYSSSVSVLIEGTSTGQDPTIALFDSAGFGIIRLLADDVQIDGDLQYNGAGVSLGANDSGGSGFRVLRVPN